MGNAAGKGGDSARAPGGWRLGDPQSAAHIFKYEGSGPWFTCAPDGLVEPRYAKQGLASEEESPATTLIALLKKAAAKKGSMNALMVERPIPSIVDKKVPPALAPEQWTKWTFQSYHDDVCKVAKGFISLGLGRFQSVNVWGFNSPEWHIAALAAMFAGGKCAGLYPTDTPDAAAYKVVHSQGAICVVEDMKKVEKLAQALTARGDCKHLKAFVAYGFQPAEGATVEIKGLGKLPVISWEANLAGAAKTTDAALEERIAGVQPGHCAGLIYTSGTTGEPKAVMISHDAVTYEACAVVRTLKDSVGFAAKGEERLLSYLPLSHIAGMMVDIVAPLVTTADHPAHMVCYFARPYDLKEKAIKDRLNAAKPTIFLGVPLVWEKIADQIRSIGAAGSGLQKKIGGAAKAVALEHSRNQQRGASGYAPFGSSASLKILAKVKAGLGLDQCKYGFTGAAPIRVDTLEYFGSLGFSINEVYGMSECTGACTFSTAQYHEWGSCGAEMPGVEVKSFKVSETDFHKKEEVPRAPSMEQASEEKYQGELCFRGRNIMMGYLACPDLGDEHIAEIKKKTAETIDNQGWLHSGDKGMITVHGMTKITGRYKELIIGEGGENIAPVPIEDEVKKACDGISEVIMIGDKRKYNVAMITLKAVGANGEVPGTDQLDAGAKRLNPDVKTITQAMDDKAWVEAVTKAITAANNNGKCCPNNAFKIQKFTILPTNFSEENGELTPTKKLKRKVVETSYAKMIDTIYESEGTYIKYKA